MLNLGPRLPSRSTRPTTSSCSTTSPRRPRRRCGSASSSASRRPRPRRASASSRSSEVAQLIQQNFLPRELPDLPGWQVAAYYRPAREVGGDFYDFFELPDGRVGVRRRRRHRQGRPGRAGDGGRAQRPARVRAAADRARRGAPAGQRAPLPRHAGEDVRHLPVRACSTRARAASGSRTPATTSRTSRPPTASVELRARGMPLGLLPGMDYEENEACSRPATALLLHSDGDRRGARSPEREMFGFPRLKETVGAAPGGQELIDRVLAELERFTGAERGAGGRHHDASRSQRLPRGAWTEFDARRASRQRARGDGARRARGARRSASSPARLEQLKTAVAEATMNAIEHGNAVPAPTGRSTVARAARGDALRVQITDRGEARPLGRARDARPRGEARGRAAAARLGTVPDREHGRRVRVTTRRRTGTRSSSSCTWKETTMATRELEVARAATRTACRSWSSIGDIDAGAEAALQRA